MERAGIDAGIARERSGKAGHTFEVLFPLLRHSFTSALAAAGVAPEVSQQLTGHADLKAIKATRIPSSNFSKSDRA